MPARNPSSMRPRSCRQKRSEYSRIVAAANLDAIRLAAACAAHSAARADIPSAPAVFSSEFFMYGKPPRDGLEINVVLEQNARDAAELSGVLAQHRVFELQHVDPLQCKSGDESARPDRGLRNSRTACGSIEPSAFCRPSMRTMYSTDAQICSSSSMRFALMRRNRAARSDAARTAAPARARSDT